jgi:hypothetical protein
VQFAAVRQLALQAGADKGIEADNNEANNNEEQCSGRSNPTLSNLTLIGDLSAGGANGAGVQLRRGTSGQVLNSIITQWKGGGFEINGSSTFANHCTDQAAIVTQPVFCNASSDPTPIVFDGNLLWNNGATGSRHYVGGVSSPSCEAGTDDSTRFVATVQYVDNSVADPLLRFTDPAQPLLLDLRPRLGSPAIAGNAGHGKVVNVPKDGFFDKACYVGAFDPNAQGSWADGWTILSLDGAGRTDLKPELPVSILDNHNYYSPRTLSADTTYLVRGQVRVKSQSSLTIPAGTVIFEENASAGTIIIERGGKIFANGTAQAPIIITSDAAPGEQQPGGGGGLVIHGLAKTNAANSCAGDSAASEGGAVGHYGGNDDDDNSGVLRYVRVEFSGVVVGTDNELNCFTFNSVGRGTVAEYLQAHRGKDDLFEWFGGTMRARYLVATYGDDDGIDWQMGFRGKVQFAAVRQLALQAGADKGIEADNNEANNNELQCAGRSNPTLSHLTLVGDLSAGGANGAGVQLRRGTGGQVLNSIITQWKGGGFEINGSSTFVNHCSDRAFVTRPGVACSGATVDAPLASGRVFVTHGYPNPFRAEMNVRFALARSGDVQVDVYSADGRKIAQLANGTFGAGQHTVTWKVGKDVPAGVYFYKVRTRGEEATGKLVRMN